MKAGTGGQSNTHITCATLGAPSVELFHNAHLIDVKLEDTCHDGEIGCRDSSPKLPYIVYKGTDAPLSWTSSLSNVKGMSANCSKCELFSRKQVVIRASSSVSVC